MAIASRSDDAATAIRSAGSPAAMRAGGRPVARAAISVTHVQASSGWRWAVSTISAAVSNGHARPSGLNGSCRLSAPGRDHDARVAQCPHGRHAPRHGLLVLAPLEVEVRRRQGDDADPGGRDDRGDLALASR